MDAVPDNIWPWTGQIYEVDMSQDELRLFHMVPGLSESERDLLLAIIQHADNDYSRTDQKTVKAHLQRRDKPCSDSLIKKNIKILSELGVFSHYTQSRPGRKPASIYSLKPIEDLISSKQLSERDQSRRNKSNLPPIEQPQITIDNPMELLEGSDQFPHAYSQKITHLILRRCSKRSDTLGEKVHIPIIGTGEAVAIRQRVASGIEPMDGSEDRTQQAMLTMFKEHLKNLKLHHPQQSIADLDNSWILDMRELCRTMGLKPSNANIEHQAKRLYQLRYNSFEIYFDPQSNVVSQFNLLPVPVNGDSTAIKEVYEDREEGTLFSLDTHKHDAQFLIKLEPLQDEKIWQAEQKQMQLGDDERQLDASQVKHDSIGDIHDQNGRLYRFYRISFNEKTFEECVSDAWEQIHQVPPSLLLEDRVIARGLAYLAQRIFRKDRHHPFELSWLDVAMEIQPLEIERYTFEAMERLFKTEFKSTEDNKKWQANGECVVALHGYCYQAYVPPGKARRRRLWRLKIWRDKQHAVTGDNSPAAYAAFLNAKKDLLS